MLHYLGYVEKWGVGTLMVWEECMKNGNGEPTFESNGSFKVILKSKFFPSEEGTEEKIVKWLEEAHGEEGAGEAARDQGGHGQEIGHPSGQGHSQKNWRGEKVKYALSF